MDIYDVYYKESVIGKAEVSREGLYKRIRCRISLSGKGFFRLILSTEHYCVPIGLFMPASGGYEIEKSLPASRLPEGIWKFFVAPKENEGRKYVPIEEGKPFSFLTELNKGRLAIIEGKPCLIPEDQSSTVT